MKCVGTRAARGVNDLRDVGLRLAEGDGCVEKSAGERDVVEIGVGQDRRDPHLAAGARDANRDLAAIRNDYAIHGAFAFLRNASIPPCPSSLTRRSAIASMVYGMFSASSFVETNAISFLHAFTASGPDVASCASVSD